MERYRRRLMEERKEGEKPQFVERRRRKDWVLRSVTIFSVVGWIVAIVAVFLFGYARPDNADMFTRFSGSSFREVWDFGTLRFALGTLVVVLIVCAAGFILNAMRMRRKSDKISRPIIVLATIAVLGIVAMLVSFPGII